VSEFRRVPIYVFLGAPGSGKGTLSGVCVDKLGWAHLSTGNLCRKHVAEGTEIGKQIDFAMKSGKLVSDSVIIDMTVKWLESEKENAQGVILDGVPRTVKQAEGFIKFLKENADFYCLRVVRLIVPEEELVARLTSRRVCQKKSCESVYSLRNESLFSKEEGICDKCGEKLMQRTDDTEETVKTRLTIYNKHAQELLDFYEKQKESSGFHRIVMKDLDGNLPVSQIFENFEKIVGLSCDSH